MVTRFPKLKDRKITRRSEDLSTEEATTKANLLIIKPIRYKVKSELHPLIHHKTIPIRLSRPDRRRAVTICLVSQVTHRLQMPTQAR